MIMAGCIGRALDLIWQAFFVLIIAIWMSKLVFKDRFSDFLSRRLSKDKKETLFQG